MLLTKEHELYDKSLQPGTMELILLSFKIGLIVLYYYNQYLHS